MTFSNSDYTEWVNLYESGTSSYQIAKLYNCDISTVCKKLKQMGVAIRPHKAKERHKELATLYPEWIKMYESGMSTVEIGRCYGIDHATVWAALKRMGVGTRKIGNLEYHQKHYQHYDEWVDLYNNGVSAKEIAKRYGVINSHTITSALHRMGVELRTPRKFTRKIEALNENVFDVIDTCDKAYFLGFMLADGNVREYSRDNNSSWSVSVGLSSKDHEHLMKIVSFLGIVLVNGNDKGFLRGKVSRFNVSSKKLAQSLIKHGCIPNKTLIFEYPLKSISKELNRHFIRGYFDGDGCVAMNKKYKNGGCGIHTIFTCGSVKFLESLRKVLNDEIAIGNVTLGKQKNCNAYHLTIYRKMDIVKVYHYLYDNAITYLDRKKQKFEELLRANRLI